MCIFLEISVAEKHYSFEIYTSQLANISIKFPSSGGNGTLS